MSRTFFDQFLYRRICAHFTMPNYSCQYLRERKTIFFIPLVFYDRRAERPVYKGLRLGVWHCLRTNKCESEVVK